MNIAYLIWLENLSQPIIKGQVFEVMKRIRKISSLDNFYFIVFQDKSNFLLKRKDFRNIRKELMDENIHLILIPSFQFANDMFIPKWYIIPLIFLQSFLILLIITFADKIDILHCRGYPITLTAIAVKKIKRNIKVIFDPRSPFPEEMISTGRWAYDSLSYKAWKYLEKKCLRGADITIAIADSYVKHFKKIYSNTKFEIIPNNTDVTKFIIDNESRNYFRKFLGIKDSELIFVYSGSLGNHWNNPKIYAKFIIKLRELDIKHRFLFVIEKTDELKKVFDHYNIESNEYFVFSVNFNDMPQYLSMADFGLNLMEKQDIRMSIKTVEYLAMGLPIITNSNVLGACEVVKQHNIGYIIDDIENINMKKLKNFLGEKDQISSRCRKLACEKFSTEEVAKQYISVYKIKDKANNDFNCLCL
ncbi:MAG: glycosyltransferase [Candidatus Methanoperedens sp.]|nr:glycosyltransferase [Candidatus Methanoperedens sp.]